MSCVQALKTGDDIGHWRNYFSDLHPLSTHVHVKTESLSLMNVVKFMVDVFLHGAACNHSWTSLREYPCWKILKRLFCWDFVGGGRDVMVECLRGA